MSGRSRPFLLTEEDQIRPEWLSSWPPGGVALVLGGSVDIRRVRKGVKQPLRENDVKVYVLHATLWGEKFRKFNPKGKFLILSTETLFRKSYKSLRDRLYLVFDMCEKHEVQRPLLSSPEMEWLQQFGHCDVLVTIDITRREQERRRALLWEESYVPKVVVAAETMPNIELSSTQMYQICGREPFIGCPLPGVHPNDTFWDFVFGWSTESGTFEVHHEETLSFNSLPLNFLLLEATNPRNSKHQRVAAILMVAAVQVVSSRGFAPVFQHGRTLAFNSHVVWDMTETSVFLDCFLTAGGRWSKEAALTFLAWQYTVRRQRRVEMLRNLEGRRFEEYLQPPWEGDLRLRLRRLLEELMRVMEEFQGLLRGQVQLWCDKWKLQSSLLLDPDHTIDDQQDPNGHVLEAALRNAAEQASNISTPNSPGFKFVFPMCELKRLRLQQVEQANGERFLESWDSAAFRQVLHYRFGRVDYRVEEERGQRSKLVLPFSPGTKQADRLVASVMFLNMLLNHDKDLDDEEWHQWQLHTQDAREDPEEVYKFPRNTVRDSAQSIRFSATPMRFFVPDDPDAHANLLRSRIFILKRFCTPDLLVLSSCVIWVLIWRTWVWILNTFGSLKHSNLQLQPFLSHFFGAWNFWYSVENRSRNKVFGWRCFILICLEGGTQKWRCCSCRSNQRPCSFQVLLPLLGTQSYRVVQLPIGLQTIRSRSD